MMASRNVLVALLSVATLAVANVEKIIFTGPEPGSVLWEKPAIADLNLHTLATEASTIRANLSRVFPGSDNKSPLGQSSWLLLDDLDEGQRYEFRVCWAAIEPTSFTLDIYDLNTVQSTPGLIQSLSEYASSRPQQPLSSNPQPTTHDRSLLIHIQAAADYFTDNQTLMKDPPPVLVDLILDPYLYNVVPRSLLPTAGYLVLVGVVTWFVATWVASTLQAIASPAENATKKRK